MTWTYESARAALAEAVDLEKLLLGKQTVEPGLGRMRELTRRLGEPQRQLPMIHLTGTNGKTSTAQIAAALLGATGMRVGLYTSPHLDRINGRLILNGQPIDDQEFASHVGSAVDAATAMTDRPTSFELLTAAAFHWFAAQEVDAAVVEVGLLGRWDATNVADGRVAVVTTVSRDHLNFAGSLEGVAREKAGIVKPGAQLVLGDVSQAHADFFQRTPAARVLRLGNQFALERAQRDPAGRRIDLRTDLARYQDILLPLHGAYQDANAACALTAVEAFLGQALPRQTVEAGLQTVRTQGRFEVVGTSPVQVLDGAHNPAAAAALVRSIAEEFPNHRWAVVYSALHGHEFEETLAELAQAPVAAVLCCASSLPRAVPVPHLLAAAQRLALPAIAAPDVANATRMAVDMASEQYAAGDPVAILVTGSFSHLTAARRVLTPAAPSRATT